MSLEPQTIEEILHIIRDDVKEIKHTLNGDNGLVTRVKVLETSRDSLKWHFTFLWGAFVSLATTMMRILWK